MFKKSRKLFKRKESKVVELEKPNTKTKRVLFFFEVVLILLVFAGTSVGLIKIVGFSPSQFFNDTFINLVPKSPIPTEKEKIDDEADRIIELLPENLFSLKEIKSRTEHELRIVSKHGTLAVFSLDKDIQFQLTTLQNLLTKAKINKKKVKSVDLRFNKVVVVYGK